MSINLKKGGNIILSKASDSTLNKLIVGLGWDPVEQPQSKGLFKWLKKDKADDFDCDASAILLNSNGKLASGMPWAGDNKLDKDVVYFGNLKHFSGCVEHMGDNLTGGEEQIFVNLANLPTDYNEIVFVVNIYHAIQRNQHFGMIKNAFIRIVDGETKKELCKYNLTEDYGGYTSMIFGKMSYTSGGWQFVAIGEGNGDAGILNTVKRYI